MSRPEWFGRETPEIRQHLTAVNDEFEGVWHDVFGTRVTIRLEAPADGGRALRLWTRAERDWLTGKLTRMDATAYSGNVSAFPGWVHYAEVVRSGTGVDVSIWYGPVSDPIETKFIEA